MRLPGRKWLQWGPLDLRFTHWAGNLARSKQPTLLLRQCTLVLLIQSLSNSKDVDLSLVCVVLLNCWLLFSRLVWSSYKLITQNSTFFSSSFTVAIDNHKHFKLIAPLAFRLSRCQHTHTYIRPQPGPKGRYVGMWVTSWFRNRFGFWVSFHFLGRVSERTIGQRILWHFVHSFLTVTLY